MRKGERWLIRGSHDAGSSAKYIKRNNKYNIQNIFIFPPQNAWPGVIALFTIQLGGS
jgi:hypothetical protein